MIKVLRSEYQILERASELMDTDYVGLVNEDGYMDESDLMMVLEEVVSCLEVTKLEYDEFKDDHYERYQLKSEYRDEYY